MPGVESLERLWNIIDRMRGWCLPAYKSFHGPSFVDRRTDRRRVESSPFDKSLVANGQPSSAGRTTFKDPGAFTTELCAHAYRTSPDEVCDRCRMALCREGHGLGLVRQCYAKRPFGLT